MKINLMDPGLAGQQGHHLDIDLRVTRQLVADGHCVHVYASKFASEAVSQAFASLAKFTRQFQSNPYQSPQSIDPVAGELLVYTHQSALLAQELRCTDPADLWLWPSIFAPQLNACAIAQMGVAVAGCVHTEATPPDQTQGSVWWRHAFLNMRKSNCPLRIGSIEPALRYGYLSLTTDELFQTFPVPYPGKPISRPRNALRKIGFLGHQRGEKGSAFVLKLVNSLIAEGYQVVLQDSSEKIIQHANPQAMLLGFVTDITEEIAQCDLIVLPYSPEQYRAKGSGILWEALATGIPVVAPYHSAPGQWVERTGAGLLFIANTHDCLLRTITTARDIYPKIALAAFENSQQWPKHHGVQKFTEAMIEPV